MSLDIVVMGMDGRPEQEVPLGVDAHSRLVQYIKAQELPMLARLSDYYEDAVFDPNELINLEAEIAKVLSCCPVDDELRHALIGIQNLTQFARTNQRRLDVLAD